MFDLSKYDKEIEHFNGLSKINAIRLLKICKYQQSQIKRLNEINNILMDVNHNSVKLIKGETYDD